MLYTVKKILGRGIELNPYEKSFSEPVNQQQSEGLEKFYKYISLLMEAHNEGKVIDIEGFAAMAGIDTFKIR